MTGKEVLLRALRRETVERTPWLPFVGVHGGQLIGAKADAYLNSSENMVNGQLKAYEMYRPDGLPIVFDLQLEAEVLGCELRWAEQVPPSVATHPLAMGKTLDELPEFSTEKGRFPLVAEATRRIAASIGDTTALYGLLTGPFTLTSHLRGSEIFLDMLMNPEGVSETLDLCAEIACTVAKFYLDNGVDVVAIVDPMTTQISPEHFAEFVAPYHNRIFDFVRECGGYSSLFVCGDAQRNLEAMCVTTCDNVQVDENISLEQLRDLAARYNKSFGGNLKLTTALLLGSEEDAQRDALRCIDIAGDAPGFILAPGCDLPYDTPSANLQAVTVMVHDEYQRDILRNKPVEISEDLFEDIQLPDYNSTSEVILDVITLDSAACAPCYYMVDAAQKAVEKSGVQAIVKEHKIRERAGIGYMCRLNVKNLPTICIDGEPRFISIIPDIDSLASAIKDRSLVKKQA